MNVPETARSVLEILERGGHEAYLVGGCVRDFVMDRKPKDWDITTSATPDQVMGLFGKVVPTGIKHGTVTVIVLDEDSNEHAYEVTTYRIDGDYSDGRHPDSVKFTSSIEEDLARRDFTMNAIAYNPIHNTWVDPFDGRRHIAHAEIRAVGNPDDRFKEDALRMLRAIRFMSQLRFGIEERTFAAISRNHKLIDRVSVERIREELFKLLLGHQPALAIGCMHTSKLLDHIIPELSLCHGFSQHSPYHTKDVFVHILDVVMATPNILPIRLAALFHDIAKPQTFTMGEDGKGHFYGHQTEGAIMATAIMKRLKFTSDLQEQVAILVREHMSRVSKLRSPSVKRFMNRVGEDNLGALFALMRADIKAHKPPHDYSEVELLEREVLKVQMDRPPMSLKDLAISGQDLIALGMKPGPLFSRILNHLLETVLDDPTANKKDHLIGLVQHSDEVQSILKEEVRQ